MGSPERKTKRVVLVRGHQEFKDFLLGFSINCGYLTAL